jgi:hypothetical protein
MVGFISFRMADVSQLTINQNDPKLVVNLAHPEMDLI